MAAKKKTTKRKKTEGLKPPWEGKRTVGKKKGASKKSTRRSSSRTVSTSEKEEQLSLPWTGGKKGSRSATKKTGSKSPKRSTASPKKSGASSGRRVSRFGTKSKTGGANAGSKPLRYPSSWSLSKYLTWEGCPHKYFEQVIAKNPLFEESSNPNIERGIEVHSKGEQYLLGKIRGVPDEFKDFAEEMKEMKAAGAVPEEMWAADSKWRECEWDDWKKAWIRAKTDAHLFIKEDGDLIIVDFKTGKVYEHHQYGAEIYAAMGMGKYPGARNVVVEFWYVDQNDVRTYEFSRNMLTAIRTKWKRNAEKMLKDRKFPKTPSTSACRFCPLRADKGGPCEAYKEAK